MCVGMVAGSVVGFGAVVQREGGAEVDGAGVVEGVAEFVDGGGVSWRGQRVESDVQGAGVVVGDDVAGAGQGGADQGVGFVVAADLGPKTVRPTRSSLHLIGALLATTI